MRHITRKRLLSFFLAMALILTFSPISAAATYAPEEHEIDEDVAVTIAMLFVWANIGESEWNRKTTVDNIIPMYNNSDEVCAYCINLTIFYKGIMPSEKVLDLPVDCNTLTGSVNL